MLNKKGDMSYLYLIGVIVLIILLAIIFKYTIPPDENINNLWEKVDSNEKTKNGTSINQESSDSEFMSPDTTTNQDTALGEGGRSEDSNENSNTPTCVTRTIYYSIHTTPKNETCLSYNGSICEQKEITCKTTIKNEDTVTASFDVQLVFVSDKSDKKTGAIKKITESYTLNPGETETIQRTETISSTGEEGLANKIINCFTNTLNDREQEICT